VRTDEDGQGSIELETERLKLKSLKMAMIESSSSNQMLTRVSAAFASSSSCQRNFSTAMPEMCEIQRYFRVVMFAIVMARTCARYISICMPSCFY
jgi:hypothetical protein